MASGCYSEGLIKYMQGDTGGVAGFEWDVTPGIVYKMQLTQSSYTPDKEVHDFLDDVSGDKVTGTTDATLTGSDFVIPTEDVGNNRVEMDYDNTVVYSSVAGAETVQYVIIYYDSTVAATSSLICFLDFSGGTIVTNGSDITITFNAEGVFALDYGA